MGIFTALIELSMWISGLLVGAALATFFRHKWDMRTYDLFESMREEDQAIAIALAIESVKQEDTIKHQRWLLSGGIDGDEDLEDISDAKDRGDQGVEDRAFELVSNLRSARMLYKDKGLYRGVAALRKLGWWPR
jgi:hypothetical protein